MIYEVLESERYEAFIMTVIILNTLWMATEHDPHTQVRARARLECVRERA